MKSIDQHPLTPKQQLFCNEYLKDLNATRAALRAGYSPATALSGKLMQFPKIKAFIKRRTKKKLSSMELCHRDLVDELCYIAFAKMGDYFDDDGKMKAMKDLTKAQKAAIWSIKTIETDKGSTVQLRLQNKLTAIEKLAKRVGFYGGLEQDQEVKYAYYDKDSLDEHDTFKDETVVKKSEGGRQLPAGQDDEEEEAYDSRRERDRAIAMENEIRGLKDQLKWQKERADAEAMADGDKEWVERNGKDAEQAATVAAQPFAEETATPAVASQTTTKASTQPQTVIVKSQRYVRGALYGKLISKEERKQKRQDFYNATGIRLPRIN